jgi:hypothetical protein
MQVHEVRHVSCSRLDSRVAHGGFSFSSSSSHKVWATRNGDATSDGVLVPARGAAPGALRWRSGGSSLLRCRVVEGKSADEDVVSSEWQGDDAIVML